MDHTSLSVDSKRSPIHFELGTTIDQSLLDVPADNQLFAATVYFVTSTQKNSGTQEMHVNMTTCLCTDLTNNSDQNLPERLLIVVLKFGKKTAKHRSYRQKTKS